MYNADIEFCYIRNAYWEGKKMIETSLLEQLVAFHDLKTLSAAAEHLLTSQPALSRSMRKLDSF